MSLSSTP